MRFKINIFLTLLLSTLLLACDGLIFDDTKDCPQGVYVSFYTKSICQSDSSYLGKTTNLHLLAFDIEGKLVKVITQKEVSLDRDYSVLMPLDGGVYSFIGWTGLDSSFELNQLTTRTTSRADVLVRLKQDISLLNTLSDKKIYQGESPVVYLPDAKTSGGVYKYTTVNLHEKTKRIHVELELHESLEGLTNIEDFEVTIYSGNGTLNIDGSIPLGQDPIQYPCKQLVENGKLKADFTMMTLQIGYNSRIILRNKKSGEELFNGNLIGSILMKNESVNLDCDNDFTVKFVIRDKCLDCYTYLCWAIYVNDWVVHSYETPVGTDY